MDQYRLTNSTETNHPLLSKWILWSHPPAQKCNKWDIDSYVKHCTISTVEEFWNVLNGFKSLVNEDMWFFMREGIPPIWEHSINKQGGRYTFKVTGDKVDNIFTDLCAHLVTENICLEQKNSVLVSGLSVSPKSRELSTVSIWDINSSLNIPNPDGTNKFAGNITGIDFSTGVYKTHINSHRA